MISMEIQIVTTQGTAVKIMVSSAPWSTKIINILPIIKFKAIG